MRIIRTPSIAARECAAGARPLVLVPTMGALHAGHASLLRKARRLAGTKGRVVASIFVNPTQFGPNEDFSRYPRTFGADCRMCREAGVDVVFHPTAEGMYPEGFSISVEETRLSAALCGKSRPGHFGGVCTVVLKLFNIVQPDIAVFGAKDFQQATIIQKMVRDLNLGTRIVVAPTVREPDGLALSSRNRYLTTDERAQAPVIRRALLVAAGAKYRAPGDLAKLVRGEIGKAPLGKIDYVEVLDAATLEAPGPATRKLVIACAVFFGKTRLIDNVVRKR